MNKFKYLSFFILIIFVLSCEQPPLAEMDSAREAVFRAENDADAVQYAAGTLARAQDALRRMQIEADSKRYDAARTLAGEAASAAEKAVNDGKAASLRAGQDSAALVNGLRSEINDTTSDVSAARYAQMDLDYDSLDSRIVNAHNAADKAEADQAAGRYQDAVATAREVRSDLANMKQIVASAAPIRKK
ncbi:MAG: DUF4398 domain-containing protein [Treponema sp.]|nr:DUF4398 domain-containing protein [Treponema sp.]